MDAAPEENQSGFSGINVTPLVDVSLVLVLIFMVTSPFFTKSHIPVNVPAAHSGKYEEHKNVSVTLSPEDGISVNETRVSLSELGAELKKQIKDTGFDAVLIRADERVGSGEVQDVMRIAKNAGAGRIAFATRPKGAQS